MGNILCYGSLNLDYVYSVPHFVSAGETMASLSRTVCCGGKGLNQSIAASRAGGKVFHAGKIGAEGGILAEALESSGVDIRYLSKTSGPTGHAIIQVDPSGQNCILLFGGGNMEINESEVESVLGGFGPGDIIMLQNEISSLGAIMKAASERGMYIVFNPSPMDSSVLNLPLETVSLLVLNQVEATAIAGTSKPEDALTIIKSKLPGSAILLTLGSKGSVYYDGKQKIYKGIYKAPVKDTTGAGDTFTGYFVANLSLGRDIQSCLDLAAKASAIAVSRLGASPSIPTFSETEACRFEYTPLSI